MSEKKLSWNFEGLENKILNVAMSNDSFFYTIIDNLEPSYFFNKVVGSLFKIIVSFYKKNKFKPKKDILVFSLNKYVKDISKLDQLLKEVDFIFDKNKVTHVEQDFIVNELDSFLRKNKIKKAILKSVDLLEKENFDSILSEIKDAVTFSAKMITTKDLTENVSKRYLNFNNPETSIQCFLPSLNAYTSGGFKRKEIAIIMAGSGVGKSTFLINQAVWSFKKDFNVLYITAELSEDQIAFRMDRSFFDMKADDTKQNWKQLESKYKEIKQNSMGKLKIHSVVARGFSMVDMRRLLEDLKVYDDFVPDIILFDYLELFSAIDKNDEKLGQYERQGILTREMRELAKEYNISVVTATQANRLVGKLDKDKENVDELDTVGDSVNKFRESDFFALQIQTKNERKDSVGRFRIMKNRNGPIDIEFKININFDKMLITERIL